MKKEKQRKIIKTYAVLDVDGKIIIGFDEERIKKELNLR